ncbi:amino acid permease/ SLC12A domain-containing protein [Obelidium mucronatum]|nr:amino acid permease/ SLC12A domain-containing protein [Obelidium mucronatum]
MTHNERSPLLGHSNTRNTPTGLHRGLKARHLIMMSVGGTIGTGLFVASGLSIANAGPGGALSAYVLVGFMVFCVLTSLGEMAALIPVSGSFHEFAGRFVDPALAWTLGWNYWLQWSISLTSEITAAGILMTFWFPSTPAWMFSAMILSALVFVNTRSVAMFGETEYWLSFVKVFAVFAFVVVGTYVDINGFGGGVEGGGDPIGFANWRIEGAPFKNGFSGFFSVISIAFFAFGGTELVGVSAGEVENPRRNVPIAINQSFWRIFGFYISSIGLIGLLIPNDDPSLSLSATKGDVSIAPFTLILERAGLISAANVMNIVILSAVISTANSAMYAASRTLMALSVRGQAHQLFSLTSTNGVPVWALFVTVLIGSTAFLGIILGEGELFNLLLTLTGTSGLLTWLSISLTHLRFRAALEAQEKSLDILPYKAPFFPFMDYMAISIGLVILVGQAFSAVMGPVLDYGAMCSLFIGVPLFFGLYLGYRRYHNIGLVDLMDCDLSPGSGSGGLLVD